MACRDLPERRDKGGHQEQGLQRTGSSRPGAQIMAITTLTLKPACQSLQCPFQDYRTESGVVVAPPSLIRALVNCLTQQGDGGQLVPIHLTFIIDMVLDNVENHPAVISAGVIPLLVRMLGTIVKCQGRCGPAVSALLKLTSPEQCIASDDAYSRLLSAGLVRHTLLLLKDSRTPDEDARSAMLLIANLTRDEDAQTGAYIIIC